MGWREDAEEMQRRGLEPTPYSTWRHLKTGSTYTVLGVAECSTNGPLENTERAVIYVSHTRQELWYRELSEFMDGRFEQVAA